MATLSAELFRRKPVVEMEAESGSETEQASSVAPSVSSNWRCSVSAQRSALVSSSSCRRRYRRPVRRSSYPS